MLLALVALFALGASASPLPASDGGAERGIGSYYFNSALVTWADGYADCASRGHKMVVLDAEGEQTKLDQYMVTVGLVHIHLGFHDKFIEGVYETITGESIEAAPCSDSPWEEGYPTDTTLNNCGGYSQAGFRDTSCDELRMTVCEIDEVRQYTQVGTYGSFKYHEVATTWALANQQCKSEGAHLVVLGSAEEANALAAAFPITGDLFWVGVHRLYGEPVTVFDDPLSTTGFEVWTVNPPHPLEPSVNYPYVAVNYKFFNAPTLHTLMKTDSFRFFCKLD